MDTINQTEPVLPSLADSPAREPGALAGGTGSGLAAHASPEPGGRPAGFFFGTQPGELDLFSIVLVLRANLLRILLFGVLGLGLMAAYVLTVKPQFTASASIIIPQGVANASAASLLQAASGLDLLGGGNEVYIDILRSRTVADEIIRRFNLKKKYGAPEDSVAELFLGKQSQISVSREGLLTISVIDTDPKLAAGIANAYVEAFDHLNQKLAINSATQQRRYFEQEMIREKDALADAEVALQQSQEKSGVVEPLQQAQASLSATEMTRATLRARQVELQAMLQGATDQNPEVVRLRAEISGLEGQIGAMQNGGGLSAGTPASRVPAQVTASIRAQRNVRFHETVFSLLERQYESAKEQEAKHFSQIEVLDAAAVPSRKSWPPRSSYTLLGGIAGLVFGAFYVLLKELVLNLMRNPVNQLRWRALKRGTRVGRTA